MYKKDLALNNLQWMICHKTKPNQTVIKYFFHFRYIIKASLLEKKDISVVNSDS